MLVAPDPALPVGTLNVVGPPTITTEVRGLATPFGSVVKPTIVDKALDMVEVVRLGMADPASVAVCAVSVAMEDEGDPVDELVAIAPDDEEVADSDWMGMVLVNAEALEVVLAENDELGGSEDVTDEEGFGGGEEDVRDRDDSEDGEEDDEEGTNVDGGGVAADELAAVAEAEAEVVDETDDELDWDAEADVELELGCVRSRQRPLTSD